MTNEEKIQELLDKSIVLEHQVTEILVGLGITKYDKTTTLAGKLRLLAMTYENTITRYHFLREEYKHG